MAKKWDEELRKAALKAAQQKGVMRQEQPSNMARAAAEAVMNRKSQNPTTKAGSNKPAFGVSANRLRNRAAIGLSAMSSVRNFEDYAKKRREQEEAEGMQRAAQNLLTATASSQSTMRIADEETQRAAEEEKARRAAAIEAANNLANQYGYKKAGGKVVYATPFNPLPDPRGERGATRAQAPGAYGIHPEDYVRDMSAIDRYMGMSAPAYDEETRTFLDKYFGGKLPNDEEFVGRYRELMKNGQLTEDEMMNFHASAGLVQKATEQNAEYLKNREQAQKDYDAAIERLGEDALKYATGREADYYERYRNTLGAKEILGQDDGKQDEISLFEAKTRLDAPFRALANDYDLHRWSQTTQQERDAYRLMREMYGEAAAEEYLDSLKGELNQRLAVSEEQLAAARAERSPLLATLESVVTAPRRGIGAIGMGVERLLGKETDLYDPRLNLTREAEAIRAETASGMGGVGGFLYNTGMSMADNIANMAMWGGLGTFATMVSMGGNSAASAFNDAVSRGADQKQATTAAVLSGMAEAVFEKFSLDNVIQLAKGGGLKNVVGNIAKQMGIEASEELATGIANAMSDYFVMGEKSSYDLAIQQHMAAGMTEEEAQRQARMDVAKEIGLGALGGALSGGVMGAGGQLVGSMRRRSAQRVLDEMNKAVEQQQTEAAEEQPEEQPEKPDVREELLREYVPQDAQEAEQPVRTEKAEEEPAKEEKPADEPETQENGAALHAVRTATMQGEDGTEKRVRVVGVMTNDGVPVMVTEDENGERNYELAEDLSFGDETDELLAYEGVERMDARALRNYLEGYNAEQGTAEEYASAYNSVYMRARGGVDYEQAALSNEDARNHLTEDAMLDAYAAGLNAYNQEHETVQPAQVETVQAQETPEGAVFSARENAKGGRISKQYTAEGFKGLGKDGQKKMLAQMELLKALASRTGRTITIVDSIKGKDGKRANAMYIPGTGEIRVALDAQEGAYAYAAMHELTHAMKHEHSGEWSGFTGFVKGVLEEGGKSWDELVEYQMDRFGYNRAQAEEEVICNTVPSILQDEANVLKLYKGNRKLFDKVLDWVKGLLNDIKVAGRELSKRSQSWAQMDALAADRKAMQEIYDRMMAVMEKPAENVADNNVVKMSQNEQNFVEDKYFARQMDHINDLKKGGYVTVGKIVEGSPLNQVGIPDGTLYFDNNKIRAEYETHGDHLDSAAFKQIPEMLNNPIAISQFKRENTVSVYGSMNFKGTPIVVGVMIAKNRMGTASVAKIRTIHARGDVEAQITDDSVLYLNPNKKETTAWFQARGIHVPLGGKRFGFIRSIAENTEEVNLFSMQDPVEETRDLLAVHNLTAENLQNALELGGLAMPSIAVIKAEQGHSMYGDISVIFDKSTIDPKASRDNEIYGGDAWTPTFPQIEYEVDEAVESRIFEKYRKLRGKVGDQISRVMYRYAGDLAGEVGKHDGVEKIIEKMKTNTDMMQMYLADKGEEPLEPVKKTIIKRTGKIQAEQYESLIQKMGVDVMRSFETPEGEKVGEHRRAWMNEHREALQRAYVEILADATGLPEENVAALAENKQNLNRMVLDAYKYMKTGGETREEVIDYEATEKAIRDAVNEKDYEKWLNDLFNGAVKRKGIRNNTEIFTPSGKRRSFAQTHWDVTLENVVRAMRSEEKTGVGMGGRNIEGAAVKKYRSIKEVKADSDRLRTIDQDEYNAKRQEFQKRFSDIVYEYAAGKDQFDAGDALVEFITQNATADGIYRLMEKEAAFYKPSRKVADELTELVEEMKNVPTGYFEAKPRRAIGFDEVAALVVPNDLNEEMRTELENRGVNLIEYESGNEDDRLAKMNGEAVQPLLFSMRDTDENVQDAMSAEQKAYAQVKGHRITAAEADKLAGEMLKLSNSEYDRQKLAAELSRTIDYIERGEDVDWNQVDEELTTIMARVMEKSRTLDLEHEQEMDELRKYFKRVRISLNKGQEKEAANKVGSYGGYRKLLFGRVSLSRTGIGLDQVWGELSDINRELFPRDAREGDQPILLLEAVDAMKPKYHTGMGMNVEESASWLTGKLHEAYLSLPAVKAAARSAKTFGDSVVALKNAMKRFEEASWSEYQNALRGIREARGAQQRTKQQEETAALRAKYVKWRERDTQARKEREMKTRYRARIERTAGTLANWIAKPTDAKHVPAGVQDSVRRMLEVLDFSGKSTKTAKELCDKLETLASAMENAQEKEEGNQEIFLERDQQMIDQIRWVAEMIRGNTEHHTSEGRGVYDLNGLELRELSKWLDVVRHVITEASKLRGSNLPGESVEQVAAMSMAEIGRKKAWKDKKWPTKQWMQHFGPDMQDSFTFFERLGPTANAIFRGLREGFDKVTQLTRQAETYTKTILKDVNLQELTGKKAKKQTFQVKGGTVELTKANIMELYVLSRREQAQGHIYGDGIRIQGDDDVRAKALTKADVARIVSTLTADEKRVAEGMQAFLSRECASWGNETSMKLLGYRKFGEEYYWPIRTDSNTRNTTKLEDNYAANINAIKNQGMTKATIDGAKNAIVIGDIFDTYTKHISNMAAYAGYALPLSDFTRWYNTRGVKTEIEQVLGKKGLTYINNFLMAVNGSGLQPDQSGLEKLAGVFSRNAKIASVGANARVVIQQPTSYARAAMYMSPKYLSKALAMKKPNEELVNRYCGIAQWKRWGFYETNIGPNLRQMIVGDETAANKARELAMKPAEWGDNWTLNRLWNACELETRELMPELARGTEEYYQAVGKRMSEIVDRTQVVDSVFHRSQMMRSKSGMAQMLTNFMSEPTKTYNMLMSAISDYADNRKNKQARNRVARALTVYAVSGLLTAAAAAVIDAFRDEDAEKEWLEKYTGAVGSNAVDQLNPLGLLPGVKDVLSMLEGYEPSRLDTQSIQRIMWAAQEIQKYAEGTSKQNLYGVSYKTAQALSSVLGVPVSNVMRDVNAVIQTVTGTSITKTPEARKSATLTQLYKAMEEGNTARAKKLREDLRLKAEMTPKEIDTALAEKLETDPKIQEAYEAKAAKDYAKMNRAINALTARGYGREVVDKAISSYDNDQKPKTEKAKDPGEQLAVTLYSKEDVVEAVKVLAGLEPGSVTESDVRAMISERVAGSEAADPEKSVKSGIQTELKKEYLAMEQKGNTAGMRKLAMVMENVLGTEQDAMDDWVRDQHADNLRAAVDGNNKTAALKAVTVMRRDGKTDSQIESSLNKYKQLYIDAMKKGDRLTANRIKGILLSLGLKGKNGKSLYTEETFADWLKEN